MKKKRFFAMILAMTLMMTGCGSSDESNDAGDSTSDSTGNTTQSTKTDTSDMFTDRDYEVEYDESKSAVIELNGDSAVCTSDTVEISGSTVTIKDEGTYILRGTLNDGMIIVNAEDTDKPQLVFDNVSINSETSAPIYILEADKVFITMAGGSTNTLTNGGTFTAIDENNIDAVIFSKQDLTLNGNGELTVSSPAGHGIACKDDLVFTSGTYTVESASQGLDANDSVRVVNASIKVDAGKDGIHAENDDDEMLGFVYIASGTFDIEAEGDGMSAAYYMKIEDGTFNIVAGGGSANATKQSSDSWGGFMGQQPMGGRSQSSSTTSSSSSSDDSTSMKGIKVTDSLIINGGTFTIDSADDAVHSNTSVAVNGGKFEIAAGDDGFHADETLKIASGTINISECYEGLEALDIEVSGGDIRLVSSDDGINAAGGTDSSGTAGPRGGDRFGGGQGGGSASSNGSILISGGNLNITASGDGIDANGSFEISGGYTVVCGPTQGDTATLDYDVSGVITGGTFIGTGASGMAQTFSDSEQGVIAVSVGNQSAGTEIKLTDSKGNTIISYAPELSFGVVILSSPDMEKGETYTIHVGSASGEFEAS